MCSRPCLPISTGEKITIRHMCCSCLVKLPFLVNPEKLRFSQADIRSTFTDPTYPSVRETVSLIRRGLLDTTVLGPLHVNVGVDKNLMWCDNNRRLFAFREAGVDSITILFDGTRFPSKSLESKLSDPAFMPRIRGEASRVQMQKPFSLPGSVSVSVAASSLNRQPYNSHQDEENGDELESRFAQLAIKSTFNFPTNPTHRDSVCSKKYGGVNRDDSVCMPNIRSGGSGVRITERNDVGFVPTIFCEPIVQTPPPPSSGHLASQMKINTSVLGSVSDRYSKRQIYSSHQCVEEDMLKNYVPTIFHEIEAKEEDQVESHLSCFHDYDYELYW